MSQAMAINEAYENIDTILHGAPSWGSCVDAIYCVMLKNISHELNGYCRKVTEGINGD